MFWLRMNARNMLDTCELIKKFIANG